MGIHIVDPELATLLDKELVRQNRTLEFVASENFVPDSVMQVQGSWLTNKYAEGYPGSRYHAGCEFIDQIEELARERAKRLFGADHANVQPHSGVNANLAVLAAALEPGDRILSMDLAHGGHLSHGSRASLTGQIYKSYHYGVSPETGQLDYSQIAQMAQAIRPRLIIAGASAYSRTIDFAHFGSIATDVDALLLVDMAHIAGLVAAGLHPSPVPHADFVTFTTTKTMRGARGGVILCRHQFAKSIDKAIFPGTQGGPILQAVAAKALTFHLAMTEEFRRYQSQVICNAQLFARRLQEAGFYIVSGGTDNHLFLVDLRPKGLTGVEAEKRLEEVGIMVNKNLIPYDTQKPHITSGIRIGTPAQTARGFAESEIEQASQIVITALSPGFETCKAQLTQQVQELCRRFPVYLDHSEAGCSYPARIVCRE